jgi:PIN domain nuclease of toxin-antitoxin system
MEENGVRPLPIRLGHSFHAAILPFHHRDPFDRMLIAQAQMEGLQLATADPVIARYDVPILWGSGGR